MIVVELVGGVGNQMFQYAAGRSVADRLDVPLGFDLRALRASEGNTRREYGLGPFNVRASVVPDRDLLGVHGPKSLGWHVKNGLSEHVRRALQRPALPRLVPIVYPHSAYHDILTHVRANSWLSGYWQSEKYFSPAADRIREDLTLKTVSAETARLERMIRDLEFPVAVHVRRGDYASVPNIRAFHGLCTPEYYDSAIRRMLEAHADARFVFFSDEPDWVEEHLKPPRAIVIRENGDTRPHEDLHLMTRCRAHIVANSSFSWWGAWLARSELVVAPAKWFNAPGMQQADIVPDSWLRL